MAMVDHEPFPRNLSVDEPALVDLLPPDPAMPPGRVSLRAIVEAFDVGAVSATITAGGGRVEAVRPEGSGQLVSLSFNHVTLRAQRARPDICHVQVAGPRLVDGADEVRGCLPEAMLHVDCYRHGGEPAVGGLLLSAFRDVATLSAGMDDLRDAGVAVVDPHTYRLGGDGDLAPLVDAAERNDPKALLNPGKLARSAVAGRERTETDDARF